MDLISAKSNSSAMSDVSNTSSLSAKLKRLKIEETLLLQSINKCVPDCSQIEHEVDATSYSTFSEFKTFSTKTKNTFKEIKLKFQDIMTSTSSQEMLKLLDIDDVKKSTLELENDIKGFKSYLQSELGILKSTEKRLNESCNENPVLINKLKRQPRIQTAKYREIVPSPVKTLMTSPFKCSEVQQFQEFMMNCVNRYGGWNEYHHNIFVNHWLKYFGSQNNTSHDESEPSVENSPILHLFLRELLPKLQDISEEEVILHIKWYSKYIYLKERQQKAIDKWRSNRKIMKSAMEEPVIKKDCIIKNRRNRRTTFDTHIDIKSIDALTIENDSPNQDNFCYSGFVRKCLIDDVQHESNVSEKVNSNLNYTHRYSSEQTESHFQKLTNQWNVRVNSKNIKTENHNNLENINNLETIKKLHIPMWRVGL